MINDYTVLMIRPQDILALAVHAEFGTNGFKYYATHKRNELQNRWS